MFIDANKDDVVDARRLGVELICRLLQVAPSSYYAAKTRAPSTRAVRDKELIPLLVELWESNYRVYGVRKLWKAARRAGIMIGRDQTARLMRAAGIEGARRSNRVKTTRPDSASARHRDLVKREFTATAPNRLWVTDLTFVPTWAGVAYVCFIVDAFSRMIVGWRVASHMRTEMVLDAIEMARWSRGHHHADLRCHGDAGSQGGFNWSSQHLVRGVCDGSSSAGRGPGCSSEVAVAGASKVPAAGRGGLLESDRAGTAEASAVAGVAQAVGARWFHNAGGIPPLDLDFTPSSRYLSFAEREEIAILNAQGNGVRDIARALGRDSGTISRELRRNAATRGGTGEYRASVAQWKANMAAKRPTQAKLVTNPRLREYVEQRLSGKVSRPDGTVVAGPQPPRFTGRNKPHRKDRAWVLGWSPEQISNRLRLDFPDDESMRISHEAIYQSLFIEARGALKKELVWCLPTGRALRVPRERSRRKTWAHVTEGTLISDRPAEADDRAVPGHWEGELLIGLERSAIGTVVERTTRFTMLVHLPREEGYQFRASIENGPALAGYGAITMKNALVDTMSTLPKQLARSVTWDRGKEMSAHALFTVETGTPVYFADTVSPWQRGTNENTNGLLRQYFPKGTDLSRWTAEDINAVAHALNSRPRKTPGWRTPAEAFNEYLQSTQQAGVATTG